jgi:hypothetical protein
VAFREGQRRLTRAEVGRVHVVLVEGSARKGEGMLQGRTCTMKRVVLTDMEVPVSLREWEQQQQQDREEVGSKDREQQQQWGRRRQEGGLEVGREHQQWGQQRRCDVEAHQHQQQQEEGERLYPGIDLLQQGKGKCEGQQVVEEGQQWQQQQQLQVVAGGWPSEISHGLLDSTELEAHGSRVRLMPGDYVAVRVDGSSGHSTLMGVPLAKTTLADFVSWSGGTTVVEKDAFETLANACADEVEERSDRGKGSSRSMTGIGSTESAALRRSGESRKVAAVVGSAS